MTKNQSSTETPPQEGSLLLELLYRFRFPLSLLALLFSVGALSLGNERMIDFSRRVDSLADEPKADAPPKMFDTRTDIWFDPNDQGLSAYRDVEDRFIAEDTVIVAFEETKDPWGVFGKEPLELIQTLTNRFEKVPFVRNVRSLTSSPWIRNGTVGEDETGLIVTDLFDERVASFDDEARLERMIAVLGARRAASLAGREAVSAIVGGEEEWKNHIGEPRFLDAIVSEDGRTAAVVVQIVRQRATPEALAAAFPNDDEDRAVGQALYTSDAQGSAVHRIVDELKQVTQRDIFITGIPVIERHFPEVGMSDMAWLGLMFLVIAGVLFAIYRRISGVVLPLVVVLASIFVMNGLVWLKGDLINNLTASTPIIMTAVGIADAVHLVTAYFLLRGQFESKKSLLLMVLRKNAMPVFLTSLTTVVAFLSLMVSVIVPVQQLGYTAAIGTVAAYFLSMTLVPAALSLIPLPKKRSRAVHVGSQESGWTDRLANFVLEKRTMLLLATIAALCVSAVGVRGLQVESDLRLMFPSDDPVVVGQNWIEDHLGGAGDLDLVFAGHTESPQGRIAVQSEFLSELDAFERRLEEEASKPGSPLSVVTSIDSGLSVLRRMHQVQNENQASFYRVPNESDVPAAARVPQTLVDPFTGEESVIPAQSASTLSAQYYLQYENGAKPAENLGPFVSPDRRTLRLAGRVAGQSSSDMLRAYEEIRHIARTEFPRIAGTEEEVARGAAFSTMRLTGKHYLFMNMMERFTDTLVNSLALALAVITIVIGFVFRSARLALISMVPNVVPLVLPLALFGWFGISLDGPAVIVATIALGICVDDTIHLLSKFQTARRAGNSSRSAIFYAFRQVGSAITWTTLTLVLGFSVLSLSDFRPNMLIGVLGATMVALAWVCDLLVTPALLSLVFSDERLEENSPRDLSQPEPAQ